MPSCRAPLDPKPTTPSCSTRSSPTTTRPCCKPRGHGLPREARHQRRDASTASASATQTAPSACACPRQTARPAPSCAAGCRSIGIFRKSGHEHLAGSLVIPVFDEQGHVAEIYGRKINDNLRKGTAYHLYLPGPHRGVWNLAALQAVQGDHPLRVPDRRPELLGRGLPQRHHRATAPTASPPSILEAFKAYGTERVLIAYDRDEAGERRRRSSPSSLAAEGIGCFRVHFPKGMDANDYALKVTPAAKSLELLLKKAEWMAGPTSRPAPSHRGQLKSNDSSVITSRGASSLPLAAPPEPPRPPATTQENTCITAASTCRTAHRRRRSAAATRCVITLGDRSYRVRGLAKNISYEQLKVISARHPGERFHLDTLDLVSARPGRLRQAGRRGARGQGAGDQEGPRPRCSQARGAAGGADQGRARAGEEDRRRRP